GPNEPFGHTRVYPIAAGLVAALLLIGVFFWAISPRKEVYRETLSLEGLPANETTKKITVDEKLSLRGRQNVEIQMRPSGTQWMHVKGRLTPAHEIRPGVPPPEVAEGET